MSKITKHKSKSKTNKSTKSKPDIPRKWHAVPLKNSFMLISILGFFITIYLVLPKYESIGIAFLLVFIVMFAAAVVSMTKAPAVIENK